MTAYYLGNDVSKGYGDFIMLNAQKEVALADFQMDDTFDGHHRLYEVLADFCQTHSDAQIYAAVESTGGYENNWYQALRGFQTGLNIQVARLNPAGVAAHSQAELKRNKTDQMSARHIAEYLINHPGKVNYQQEDPLAALRKQWGLTRLLIKQQTQLFNQLQSLLYSACPEILTHCRHGMPQWVLKLLVQYPTAARLAKARKTTLVQIPYITEERAAALIAAAKQSVAAADDAVTAQVIQATALQIQALEKTINEQGRLLAETCDVPQIKILTSFIGIGETSAIGLWLEIGSIERFAKPKHLASYFGVHPVYRQSGDGSMGYHMSKQGRIEPRRILFMTALNAIRNNPLIKEIYDKHVAAGMEKMAALGLCMHTILRIVFGMLKHNKPFDPELYRSNQQKSRPLEGKPATDKKRRFQPPDQNAPISGRQAKKRAKQNPTGQPDLAVKSSTTAEDNEKATAQSLPQQTAATQPEKVKAYVTHDKKVEDHKSATTQLQAIAPQPKEPMTEKNSTMRQIWQILA